MQRYIIIRFGQGIIALWIVTVIVFGISRGTGDPSNIFLGIDARKSEREAARVRWGLDKPLVQQYGIFLGKALKGDLGQSLKFPELGAAGVVFKKLPATLYLAGVSLVLAIGIGVPLGVLGAVKRDTIYDTSSKVIALLGQSVPNFWLGLMMMWLFAVQLGWLPTSGYGGFKHMIMPAITLGSFQVAAITRLVRSSMLETLDSEYVKLARIKGVSERKVIWKHCLRNAALTPLTYFGVIAAVTLTGSVTTETVFNWPGTGLLAFQSVVSRDFQLIQALVLVFSSLFILSSFFVDVIYAYLDPRIRYN
jgi:peptide/nickel transport system permease protein